MPLLYFLSSRWVLVALVLAVAHWPLAAGGGLAVNVEVGLGERVTSALPRPGGVAAVEGSPQRLKDYTKALVTDGIDLAQDSHHQAAKVNLPNIGRALNAVVDIIDAQVAGALESLTKQIHQTGKGILGDWSIVSRGSGPLAASRAGRGATVTRSGLRGEVAGAASSIKSRTGKTAQEWLDVYDELATYRNDIFEELGEEGLVDFVKAACFPAGTPVLLADGTWRDIAALRVGDVVLARDEYAPQATAQANRIVATMQRPVARTHHLRFHRARSSLAAGEADSDSDGYSARDILELVTTDEHPFWSLDAGGWVPAEELSVGTVVRGLNEDWEVVAHEIVNGPTIVYNLTVEGAHTYFVGDVSALTDPADVMAGAVWVHNECNWKGFVEKFGKGIVDSPEFKQYIANAVGKSVDDVSRADWTKALKEYNQSFEDNVPGLRGTLRRKVKISPGGENVSGLSYEMDLVLGKQRRSVLRNGQDHHILPDSLADMRSGEFLKAIGFDMDSFTNGMRLPDRVLADLSKTVHKGGHDAYTAAMDQLLVKKYDQIISKYGADTTKWSSEALSEARRAVKEVRVRARVTLRSGSPPLSTTRAVGDIDVPTLTDWWVEALEEALP